MLLRLERNIGPIVKNREKLKELLRKREGDSIRSMVEEHYRQSMSKNIDKFLAGNQADFTKKMKKLALTDRRLEKRCSLYHPDFEHQFATEEILMDNFDHRANQIGTSADNLMDSIKHEVGGADSVDISGPNVFIKDLLIKYGLSQKELMNKFLKEVHLAEIRKEEAQFRQMQREV